MVLYEGSRRGRAALRLAVELARERRSPLTVLSVTPLERENVGCARCREGAALWNVEMADVARQELREAERLLAGQRDVEVGYVVERGELAHSVASACACVGADLVVVPWQGRRPLGALRRRRLARRLGRQGELTVVVGPEPGAEGG